MGHTEYILKKPIQHGEVTITKLTIRDELVAGDLRGIPARSPMNFEDILKIAGRLAAQPDAVLNKMGMADTAEVVGMVGGFLNAGQETGPTP